MTNLNEVPTSELLKEVMHRGIIPHEYQLIFRNTVKMPAPLMAGYHISIQPYERQPGDGYEIECQWADLEPVFTPKDFAQKYQINLTGPSRITVDRTIPHFKVPDE